MKLKASMFLLVLGCGMETGSAMQQGQVPDPMSIQERSAQRDESPTKRLMEMYVHQLAGKERQKRMTRDADELLHLAGQLQLKAQKTENAASQAEMLHQLDTIEKLARDVREEMRGPR